MPDAKSRAASLHTQQHQVYSKNEVCAESHAVLYVDLATQMKHRNGPLQRFAWLSAIQQDR